jgi:hypothetical protein
MAARSQAQQQANHHTLHGQSPFSKETIRFNHTHELPPQINNSVARCSPIKHALLSVPFIHNVLIFSDSKSTIGAITNTHCPLIMVDHHSLDSFCVAGGIGDHH